MSGAYPNYRDSGVEWLGRLPGHWKVAKLKYLADFTGGGTPDRSNLDYWGGSIPWVSPKDMKVSRINTSEECISERGLSESASTLVDIGAVLLVVSSGILKHTIPVAINAVPVALNQDIRAVRFDQAHYLPAYFAHVIMGHNDQLLYLWRKQGATVESIEQEYLSETRFPVPPLAEQCAIAAFLDRETGKIDALVEEQRRLIALLKEKRQAVISHAVTKGLDPSAPLKDPGVEWLGEIPAGWQVMRLRFATKTNPSKSEIGERDRTEEVAFLPMEAVGESGSLDRSQVRRIEDVETGYTYFRDGDVGYAKITPCFENGKGAVLEGLQGGVGFGTTELTIMRPISGTLGAQYLYWITASTPFRLLGEASMYGAGGQKRVPDRFARDFTIGLPTLQEQVKICEFLDAELRKLDELMGQADRAIALLKERRSALISAAVTGKIDVRGEIPISTEAA